MLLFLIRKHKSLTRTVKRATMWRIKSMFRLYHTSQRLVGPSKKLYCETKPRSPTWLGGLPSQGLRESVCTEWVSGGEQRPRTTCTASFLPTGLFIADGWPLFSTIWLWDTSHKSPQSHTYTHTHCPKHTQIWYINTNEGTECLIYREMKGRHTK